VIGTKAIIGIDYELKDYRSMNLLNHQGIPKENDNRFIDEDFRTAATLRTGLEYRVSPQFSVRAGYAFSQPPYETAFKEGRREAVIVGTVPHYTIEGNVNHFTCGIGYRITPEIYVDAALIYRTQKDDAYYFPSIIDKDGNFTVASTPATVTHKLCKGLLTVGYKF
jgi:long-subunit fatty acid transport protein